MMAVVALFLPLASCAFGLLDVHIGIAYLVAGLTLAGGGAACWFCGQRWNRPATEHSLYFVPLQYWGVAYVCIGLLLTAGGTVALTRKPAGIRPGGPVAAVSAAEAPVGDQPAAPKPEDVVRRVKASTVYIRSTFGPRQTGTGSGFLAGEAGYVVTNAHVIGYGPDGPRPATMVEVVVDSGEPGQRVFPARVFGVDAKADLALLQIKPDGLPPPLSFGAAERLTETEEVVVFGYPFGEMLGRNISVNRTTVSSLRKKDGRVAVVQLAGGLNPGNSGGPVVNARGEVVGVSVARLRATETIAFAIPAEDAATFVQDQMASGGRIDRGNAKVAAAPPPPQTRPARSPAPKPPGRDDPDPPSDRPFPVDPALKEAEGKVYLDDMKEFGWKPGPVGWRLGKNGQMGNDGPKQSLITVKGRNYSHGLGMHPPAGVYTRACYALGSRATSFEGAVGLNEPNNNAGSQPTRFVILGDGKVLWKSSAIKTKGVVEDFKLDVSQVEVLELRVYSEGPTSFGSHAVWLDPHVVLK
jgi:S1-C subfamily serine protease